MKRLERAWSELVFYCSTSNCSDYLTMAPWAFRKIVDRGCQTLPLPYSAEVCVDSVGGRVDLNEPAKPTQQVMKVAIYAAMPSIYLYQNLPH